MITGRSDMDLITLRSLTDIKKEQGSIPASLNPEVRCSDEPVTTNLLSLFAVAKISKINTCQIPSFGFICLYNGI